MKQKKQLRVAWPSSVQGPKSVLGLFAFTLILAAWDTADSQANSIPVADRKPTVFASRLRAASALAIKLNDAIGAETPLMVKEDSDSNSNHELNATMSIALELEGFEVVPSVSAEFLSKSVICVSVAEISHRAHTILQLTAGGRVLTVTHLGKDWIDHESSHTNGLAFRITSDWEPNQDDAEQNARERLISAWSVQLAERGVSHDDVPPMEEWLTDSVVLYDSFTESVPRLYGTVHRTHLTFELPSERFEQVLNQRRDARRREIIARRVWSSFCVGLTILLVVIASWIDRRTRGYRRQMVGASFCVGLIVIWFCWCSSATI